MLNAPDDLDERTIIDALRVSWDFGADTVEYRAVGFGSHHWQATDGSGGRRFVTIDDLGAKVRDADDTADAAFDRLGRTFAAVRALHDDARLHAVVAPLAGHDGTVVRRLDERYSMVVHPFLEGANPGDFDGYDSGTDRESVLDLLVELHASTAAAAPFAATDGIALPHRSDFEAALARIDRPWDTGPYGEPAGALLAAQAAPLRALLRASDRLAGPVRQDTARMVITHGEPHAGNVLVVDGRHRLIDWDTALIAPPERDLWMLDPGDGSILEAYRRATGITASADTLDLYRLWFDLDEIGGYLALFGQPHGDDANTAESWANLVRILRPEERWPSLIG